MSDLPRFGHVAKVTAILWYWIDGEYRGVAYETRSHDVEFTQDEQLGPELGLVLRDPTIIEDLVLLEKKG